MNNKDIRWIQRFANYQKAFNQLSKFIEKGELNELEEQGLIKSFEYTHELAWNTLKDLLESRGNRKILGSKDAIRLSFRLNLIENGDAWMEMTKDRRFRGVRARLPKVTEERFEKGMEGPGFRDVVQPVQVDIRQDS